MEFLEPTQPMDDWMIDEKDIKLSEKDKSKNIFNNISLDTQILLPSQRRASLILNNK